MTRVPVLHNRNFWNEPFELMSRLFSRWTPSAPREREDNDFFAPFFSGSPFEFVATPAIDLEETEKDIVVRAETPGMEKNEFSIELENDTLILRGEKKHKEEHKDRNVHRVECRYGRFDRRVALPAEVEADKAAAEYKNGVLTITIPKSESARRKAIAVKVN